MFSLSNLFGAQVTPERQEELRKKDAPLLRDNGFEIVGTLSCDEGFLTGSTTVYTLKKDSDANAVYTGCVVRTKANGPAVINLKRV